MELDDEGETAGDACQAVKIQGKHLTSSCSNSAEKYNRNFQN